MIEINIFSIIFRKRLVCFEYDDIFIFIRVLIVSPALSAMFIIIILSSAPVLIRVEYSIILLTVTEIIGVAVIEKEYLTAVIE